MFLLSLLFPLALCAVRYVAISLNELHGLELHCEPGEFKRNAAGVQECPVTSGQQTIDLLGLDFISMAGAIWVLVGMILFFRLVSYIAIR